MVAARLKGWARENGFVISTPGAVYAVGNARELGLLGSTNRWTASGLALTFLSRVLLKETVSPILSSTEERLYLKAYLMGAGALQVKFASWLLEQGSVTDEQLRRGSVLEKLIIAALEEYLTFATDLRDRTAIRQERERLSRIEYSAVTKRHKRYPVLTTMLRLRLIELSTESDDVHVIKPDSTGRLAALAHGLPNIEILERLIRENRLQQVLDVEMREYTRTDLPSDLRPLTVVLQAYDFAIKSGLQACGISFLDDVLAAIVPSSPERQSPTVEQLLDRGHRALPGEIRFHVDRRGKRAFVLLSKKAVDYLAVQTP
jgi:hypothetical protein